jgi:phosphoribosyl-dephospho-CoA transferase
VQALNTIQMADNVDFQEEEHLINEELHLLIEQEDLKNHGSNLVTVTPNISTPVHHKKSRGPKSNVSWI